VSVGPGLRAAREAAIVLLGERTRPIELDFVIDGRPDDPRFSLSEDIASRSIDALRGLLGR
jgi:hypothetical protein